MAMALVAGVICGFLVLVFFLALDRAQKAAPAAPATPPIRSFAPQGSALTRQLERFGRPVTARLPTRSRQELRQMLSRAGDPGDLTPAGFAAARVGLSALLGLIGLILGLIIPLPIPAILTALIVGAIAAGIGFLLPQVWLNSRIATRRREIQRSLADSADLLCLVVESGLSLDEGMLSVTERFHNALGDEIGKVLREIRLGRPRLAALEEMANNVGVQELHQLVESIVQSEQMGVPIARLLRVQARELRKGQRQLAQERAAQASLKMIIPMVGCIFPVLWIILLGPALILILSRPTG